MDADYFVAKTRLLPPLHPTAAVTPPQETRAPTGRDLLTASHRRTPGSRLGRDVLSDPLADMYVALWKHNRGKWQRSLEVEKTSQVISAAQQQSEIERALHEEEGKRLKVYTDFAKVLLAKLSEGKAREEDLLRRLKSIQTPSALRESTDPVVVALRQTEEKRLFEAKQLSREISRKSKLLIARQREIEALKVQIAEASQRAEEKKQSERAQETTTLAKYLLTGDGVPMERSASHETGGDATGRTSATLHQATPTLTGEEEWVRNLRLRRGENLNEIFEESHASPLTMLLSPKANFGHRKEETRRMLETIAHMSPVQGTVESFSGAEVEALYDVSQLSSQTSKLEEVITSKLADLEDVKVVHRDHDLLRKLLSYKEFDDPRGTYHYVAQEANTNKKRKSQATSVT